MSQTLSKFRTFFWSFSHASLNQSHLHLHVSVVNCDGSSGESVENSVDHQNRGIQPMDCPVRLEINDFVQNEKHFSSYIQALRKYSDMYNSHPSQQTVHLFRRKCMTRALTIKFRTIRLSEFMESPSRRGMTQAMKLLHPPIPTWHKYISSFWGFVL